ncbi:MAG: DUF4355 domain-containing protein [Clostridium sp.]|uniref:DUF4355 domain-containing protein n=1 Tax=Clostridium sp. TaxID=1506 RepID=UPI002902F5D3|nr:DUF4355 domain-containing protein [Clostridium sp.]MDU1076764.1 DUF4355 domain-containing protein [Clostridium sp.]MDU1125062.1 DUF4355 domain-containing protein [Clostridium sp.]MDU3676269.1 DUF4355 domain-containing protein [Clostridium sp.]MDU6875813.1 DUF4355 domain-containing protein [Clostridium sp.]MDU6935139.1 DUF4355 domain-containing protein [Clostridium sp.]
MKKNKLLGLIKNAKDDEDINSLLLGSDIEEEIVSSGLTLEAFKEKIKNDKDFKAYMESENDKYHNKALKTWKENNLEKELEPFIKEKYPDLVTDPMAKKLADLEKQLADEKAANARKDLLAEVMKYAKDKKLPASVVEKCLGEDFDKTKEVIDSIAEDWSKGLEAIVTEKMKQSSYVPGNGSDGKPISIGASIAAQNNSRSSAPSNPWGDK